jgi:hypothetical protein
MVAYPFSLRMTALRHRHDMPPTSDHHQLSGITPMGSEKSHYFRLKDRANGARIACQRVDRLDAAKSLSDMKEGIRE